MTNACVTFPEYMWAKKMLKKFFRYLHYYFQYGGWKMDTQQKKLENPILRCYLVSKAHKNKIPTAVPTYVFTDDLFNGNNIHVARCRRHNGNKYGGQKAEVVSVRQMLLTSQ